MAATAAVLLVPALMAAMPPKAYQGPLWVPKGHKLAKERSVPGTPLPASAGRAARARAKANLPREPHGVPVRQYHAPAHIAWPAGTGVAWLSQAQAVRHGRLTGAVAAWQRGPQAAGKLPVTVSASAPRGVAPAAIGTAGVSVAMARQPAVNAAGIRGVVMRLRVAGAQVPSGPVTVRLSYRRFADAYGGAWASRLHLVELPACALTTPAAPGCGAQWPVAGGNDDKAQQVWARITLPGSSSVTPMLPKYASAGARPVPPARTDVVLAAVGSADGPDGSYSATSLNPAGTWSVQDGDFTYNYPVSVPPALGGTTPTVTFNYDSQSVDGETSGTNTQGGIIGDGWSYSPGFIERSYQPCSQSGVTGLSNSGDQCWDGFNGTLSLAGHSSALVQNGSSGAYRLQRDDGTSAQLVSDGSNGSNGLWHNEYWLVTTTDGTKYYFGADHVPGFASSPATNSAWGMPVYNPVTGDPCFSASTGTSSFCTMGYRWNLDFVVDPHGNLIEYNYNTETNYYNRGAGQATGNKGTLTQYVRAGYPTSVSYGMLLSQEQSATPVKPGAQVLFHYSQRCLTPVATCAAFSNLTATTAKDWPDVPFSQLCQSTGTCSNWGPTFFSTFRLTSVVTQVLPSQGSTTYNKADTYTLAQSFPVGATAGAVMFLNSIQRTGNDGGSAALPAVTFTAAEMDNRVPGSSATPVDRPRIEAISTETGEQIAVSYRTPNCTQGTGGNVPPAQPDANTLACYPVDWTPPGVNQAQVKDWFIKSLVSQVALIDKTGAGSIPQVSNYTYLGKAAWHWDQSPVITKANRLWDEFRGYEQVESQTGTAPDPITETIDTYMRGMYGDETAAGGTTTTQVTDPNGDAQNDFGWLSGQVMEADTYSLVNGVQTIAKRDVTTWPGTATQTASQAPPAGSGLPTMTADLVREIKRSVLLLQSDNTYKSDTDTAYYNSDGLVRYVDHAPQGLTATCTTTSYATPPPGNAMMADYPDRVTTVTGAYTGTACPAASSGDIVADSETFYDDQNGSLTAMGQLGSLSSPGGLVTGNQTASGWPSGGSETWQPVGATIYDGYGRIVSKTDANGKATTTGYTPATQALPTKMTVTDPSPMNAWTTVTTLDQDRQLATSVTDVNGEVTTETYDALGRLVSVTTPIDQGTGDPTYTYAYHVTATSPSTVTTSSLREDGSYAVSVGIYDGMAQLRQQQSTPADNSAGRLITDTFYDSHGWVQKTSAPYYDSTTSPDATLFVATDDEVPSQTVTTYDELDRMVSSAQYSLGHLQWQTTTKYLGMSQVDTTPPAGGTATSSFTNVLGQQTATWRYGGSATPTDNRADAIVTSYAYNAAGQQTSITDANGNAWGYTYNLLGRQLTVTDPGMGTKGAAGQAGTTSYTYDPDGNIASVTDPMGNVVTYSYDALDRKTAEFNATPGVPNEPVELASWLYDTVARGQLTSSTSYDSTGAGWVQKVSGYNAAYQPTGTSLTVPADAGALATGTTSNQYTTQLGYTPLTGLPEFTAYSADGGLQPEVVDYTYDLEGLLTQYGSGTAYLDNTTYTPQGQVTSTTFGPAGHQVVQDYNHDPATGRLLSAVTNLQTLTAAADTYSYTYSPSGNITSSSDAQGSPQVQTQRQCYQYNNLSELTQAWTDSGGTTTAPAPSVPGIGGCTSTTPTATTIGGAAPYWQSFSYDALGDRTEEISHDTASPGVDTPANETVQQSAYTGATTTTSPYTQATGAQGQPDAAQTMSTTGPGGTASTTNSYNADGQLTSIGTTTTGTTPPTAPPGASISYNVQGLVSAITTASGKTTSYFYDASGNLLLQTDPSTTTLYLDNGAEEITLSGATVGGVRIFSNSPDGTQVTESSAGTVSYLTGNQQHTALESVDASTLAISRRYFDPWGNAIGPAVNWPDNLGYIGKPSDPVTGFDLLGARQYDPVTGSFISLDPVLEAGDSRQMGGYSYAADNPTTGSDPTGLYFHIGDCVGSLQFCEHMLGGHGGGGGGGAGGGGGGGGGDPWYPQADPNGGCPASAYSGCMDGPNFEFPTIEIGPKTIIDALFLTVTVHFTGTVGHETDSPFKVNMGKSGEVESCDVELPDGATVSVPTKQLFDDFDSGKVNDKCSECSVSTPPLEMDIGGFHCSASLSANGAGELSLDVSWEGEHNGFTGGGDLEVGLQFHWPGRAMAFVLANPPPFEGSIQAAPTKSVMQPAGDKLVMQRSTSEQGDFAKWEDEMQAGETPSTNTNEPDPCTLSMVTPLHGQQSVLPDGHATIVLTAAACGPDEFGGGRGEGDDDGEGLGELPFDF